MTRIGKRFEEDFRKSVPESMLLYRLRDSAQAFGMTEQLRFSARNPFDYLMWCPEKRLLYAMELKTVSGKSVSFERDRTDKGVIHLHQIQGLTEWDGYEGTVCGFVIAFRSAEETIFVPIAEFKRMTELNPKKSFTRDDIDRLGIGYARVPQTLVRTRYRYDVAEMVERTQIYGTNKTKENQNGTDGKN